MPGTHLPAPPPDTAARSLEHWSEAGRAEMEAFYCLATEDYRQLARAAAWPALLTGHARSSWRLLDVACGSGKFPAALLAHTDLSGVPDVAYDLLDPSAFSLSEARAQLRHPFVAAREFLHTIQEFQPPAEGYDVLWATHALYAVPPDELAVAAKQMVAALRPGGLGVVAQATSRSHYLTFYDAYRSGLHPASPYTPYTSAEQVQEALVAAGAEVREQRLTYSTGTSDRAVAEGFLQRCAFDASFSLTAMEAAPILGDHLASCRTASGAYSFEHEVSLLWF